ncbi:MAG: DUF1565 domain-containing protein [Bifidobacterium scardovii]
MTQYHVSASAVGAGAGTESDPFRTIGQAAAIARAGDEVIVHAGTYRESVDPRYGGESATDRIVYRAAEGSPAPSSRDRSGSGRGSRRAAACGA